MLLYKPSTGERAFEVEIHESGGDGEVTLYVGGMPILYLDPASRCVRFVPNDTGEDIGLIFGSDDCVHVVKDKLR